jgi:hypothetical protein
MNIPNSGFMQELCTCFREHGIGVETFFDRVHLHLDGRTLLTDLKKKDKHLEHELPGSPHLDRKLELFCYNSEELNRIAAQIQGDYKIHYVEVAIDFVTNSKQALEMIESFFYDHLVREQSGQYHFHKKEKTVYFDPAERHSRIVCYSDKPSKRSNSKYCFHLEARLTKKLTQEGIMLMDDLLSFDFLGFFDRTLDFRRVNRQRLGELISLSDRSATRQTYCARGKTYFERMEILQKLLSEHKEYKSAFEQRLQASSIEKALENYSQGR